MPIDNSNALNAIDTIKSHIQQCFNTCKSKGSTYTGDTKLAHLNEAINLIPAGGGSPSVGVIGAPFNGFNVAVPQSDTPWDAPEEFTIDFSLYGTGWKSIICYSDTKQGHFNITKISDSKCVISSAVFYDSTSAGSDESFGIYPDARGTFLATYTVSGNSITFSNCEYDASSSGWDGAPEGFNSLTNQVNTFVNDYFVDQYKLDKINIYV